MNEAVDAHPEAGAVQGGEAPSDESGMSLDDAVGSSYDDWDRGASGIAEGERQEIGGFLKGHADSAGVTVRDGLNSLIAPAVALRHGDMQTKRQVVGQIIDDYSVQPMPMAEPEPAAVDEFGDPIMGESPAMIEEAMLGTVQAFTNANPDAMDPVVHGKMIDVLADMSRQGFAPSLETAYQHAINSRDGDHLSRAKAASVQVSGGSRTSPNQGSDDVADILNELTPNW